MKKRAEKIKGILDIDSRIGQGTTIIFKCKLPVKRIKLKLIEILSFFSELVHKNFYYLWTKKK